MIERPISVWIVSLLCLFGVVCQSPPAAAANAAPKNAIARGEVAYEPAADETAIPAAFRMPAHTFAFEARSLEIQSRTLQVWDVTFPSPVETASQRNNTVHCEYYQPLTAAPGKAPAVIVLHILGGDFALSRLFCNALAQRGVAALFLKLPYYGERRDPHSSRRMISPDPNETVAGMTQAILDIRQAAAWLGAQPEVDREKLGIFGISLGGITSALAATAEPRLKNVCLLLAGGDVGAIAENAWERREVRDIRQAWLAQGGTREEYAALLGKIDPVRYGANVRGRHILMLNALADEVIPRVCTESLWTSFGKPRIIWFDGGHYSVIWHLLTALHHVTHFFAPAGE